MPDDNPQTTAGKNPAPGADTYNLMRFIDAQQSSFDIARAELAAGQKRSHWMWFIFPQIHGLGSSSTAQHFAISSVEEGLAYLEHPVLGHRLLDCTALVNAIHNRSIHQIFGYPDDLKFHSSVTLFAEVAATSKFNEPVFNEALATHFAGQPDERTLRQLRST